MAPSVRSSPRRNALHRVSPYQGRRLHSSGNGFAQDSKVKIPKPLGSLESFLSNFVVLVAIQDDDEIAEMIFDRTYSKDLDQTANGEELNFAAFKEFLMQLRSDISDRRLVSEDFVVVPGDSQGLTGTVAHKFEFTGIQADEETKNTVVAVVAVGLNKKEQRQIHMESFVFRTDRI